MPKLYPRPPDALPAAKNRPPGNLHPQKEKEKPAGSIGGLIHSLLGQEVVTVIFTIPDRFSSG